MTLAGAAHGNFRQSVLPGREGAYEILLTHVRWM